MAGVTESPILSQTLNGEGSHPEYGLTSVSLFSMLSPFGETRIFGEAWTPTSFH
jgi:hypothetical protein